MKASFCYAAFVLTLGAALPAQSKTLLSCGDLTGNSYFASGGIVSGEASGWRKDGVSPARILLVVDDGGAVTDIRMQDAAGWFSYANDGCSVASLKAGKNDTLIVTAVCPWSVDSFMFIGTKSPQLIFSQLKAAPAITKGATMTANCRVGD